MYSISHAPGKGIAFIELFEASVGVRR